MTTLVFKKIYIVLFLSLYHPFIQKWAPNWIWISVTSGAHTIFFLLTFGKKKIEVQDNTKSGTKIYKFIHIKDIAKRGVGGGQPLNRKSFFLARSSLINIYLTSLLKTYLQTSWLPAFRGTLNSASCLRSLFQGQKPRHREQRDWQIHVPLHYIPVNIFQ